MKIQTWILITVAALSVAGCAADHNDTVLPGYYDGYHIPPYGEGILTNSPTTTLESTSLNAENYSATHASTVKIDDDDE